MISIKETLLHTVEQLTESEAKQVLQFANSLHKKNELKDSIMSHPSIKLPEQNGKFASIIPVNTLGIPLSEQLINDRL